jgi:hypothetical protein
MLLKSGLLNFRDGNGFVIDGIGGLNQTDAYISRHGMLLVEGKSSFEPNGWEPIVPP